MLEQYSAAWDAVIEELGGLRVVHHVQFARLDHGLKSSGIPTVPVATHEFMLPARAQASALGRPEFEPVYVPHPIQDQTKEAIEARADEALMEIVARLTAVEAV